MNTEPVSCQRSARPNHACIVPFPFAPRILYLAHHITLPPRSSRRSSSVLPRQLSDSGQPSMLTPSQKKRYRRIFPDILSARSPAASLLPSTFFFLSIPFFSSIILLHSGLALNQCPITPPARHHASITLRLVLDGRVRALMLSIWILFLLSC